MKRTEVKFGDIVHSNDDTMIEVHHIGENGEVCYCSYADNARERLGEPPYSRFYGYIGECRKCTEEEIKIYRKYLERLYQI